jgi:hypothetical protein
MESTDEDVESKFGRILSITQILQYAGSGMSSDQVGQLIKNLPYGNKKEVFNTLTVNYDTATNMILALDRGTAPYIPQYANLDYLLAALTNRTVQADFPQLPQEIQAGYIQTIQNMEKIKSEQMLQVQQAQMGQIPMDGFLITCNASVDMPDSNGNVKQQRIKLPSGALSWLVQKMQQQGAMAQQTAQLPLGVQADIGNTMQSQPALQQNSMPQA